MEEVNLHSTANDNGYVVSWKGHEVAKVTFFMHPQKGNDVVYWNTGAELVSVFCIRYRKSAKKRRFLKKWIRRFGAIYRKVNP